MIIVNLLTAIFFINFQKVHAVLTRHDECSIFQEVLKAACTCLLFCMVLLVFFLIKAPPRQQTRPLLNIY